MPRTFKLTLAYDGTEFAGWQRQAADRTVQATVEDALAPLEGLPRVVIIGAGRTDAGVHAAGQVASVTLQKPIEARTLHRALNATLPFDVRVMAVEEMADGFNAQFAARRKTYRYAIWSQGVVPPQIRRTAWHVPQALDVPLMDQAAGLLIGEHDFAAFQASGGDVITTRREVFLSAVSEDREAAVARGIVPAGMLTGTPIGYEITASGFLRHMVRNIAGALVEVGRGRCRVSDLGEILESRDRRRAPATAPAHGLTLWSVDY